MTCHGHASTHDNRNARPYYRACRPRVVVLCDGCATGLNALYESWVWRPDLRVVPDRTSKDASHRRPRWLARLRGRDESGRLVA